MKFSYLFPMPELKARLLAVAALLTFMSSDTWYGTYSSVENRNSSERIELPIAETEFAFQPLSPDEMADKKNQLSRAQERMTELRGEFMRARQSGEDGPDRRQLLQMNHVVTMLEKELNTYDEDGKPIALAMGVTDSETVSDAQLLVRGEVALAQDPVPRGFLQVLSNEEAMEPLPEDSSGRLELAQWIASLENPLTARVMANRVWMHLMGNGIGATGDKPSHPELLDHLALQFVADEWSVKELIRDIVLSRTDQLSSDFESTAFTTDPENALRLSADRAQAGSGLARHF